MNEGINYPQELRSKQNDYSKKFMKLKLNEKAFSDSNKTDLNDFIQFVEDSEAFIRKECIDNNNYITIYNDLYQRDIRFTGAIISIILHDMQLIIYSKIDTANWIAREIKFLEDLSDYFKSQSQFDGICLMMLLYTSKVYYLARQKSLAKTKFEETIDLFKSLNLNNLDWAPNVVMDHLIAKHTIRTLDYSVKANILFANTYLDLMYLFFYDDNDINESSTLLIHFENLLNTMISIMNDNTIDPTYCRFIENIIPERISFFEKSIAALWFNNSITNLKKLELFYSLLPAYNYSDNFRASNVINQNSISIVDNKNNSIEIMNKISNWAPSLFIEELFSDINNSEDIINSLNILSNNKGLNNFLKDLKDYLDSIESISTLLGEKFINIIDKLQLFSGTSIFDLLIDSINKSGLTAITNSNNSSDIVHILTSEVTKNLQDEIILVCNKKSGLINVTIEIDNISNNYTVEISNFVAKVPITIAEFAIVKAGFDITIVTAK